MSETVHYRTCPLCEATCGLEITMSDGAVQRIRGDREDVFSKGFICPKGSTLKQLHEDPDRLRTPLVRVNGELQPARWDEAFAAIEAGLSKIWADGDRNAVGIYLGNPSAHTLAGTLFGRTIIKPLGTRNVFSASTVDQMPKHASSGLMFGNPGAMPVPDIDRTDYLLMLGANPLESNGSLATAPDWPGRLDAIRERGGTVIVVDPRRSKTAERADEHIAIRPGTDAMFLAALITEIAGLDEVNARLHNDEFRSPFDAQFNGLDELLAALAPFTAESIAAHTRIPAATTRRVATAFAAAPTAVCYGRVGAHTTVYGTLASWLTDALNALTGNLDRPGGAMFPRPSHSKPRTGPATPGKGFATGRWTSRVNGSPEVNGELPSAEMADEILTEGPGQIRAMITLAGNPVRSCPDSQRLDAAFDSLEFMVSVDIYVNETTRHADVILPSPSPLAKPHYDLAFHGLSVRNVVNFSEAILSPEDPSEPGMDEHEILARLALIVSGFGAEADPQLVYDLMFSTMVTQTGGDLDQETERTAALGPIERLIDVMVRSGPYDLDFEQLRNAPHGIDLGPLEPRLAEILRTPSARVELAPPILVDDLTRLTEALNESPADGLLLVGRRHLRSNNSWMHNLPVLVKGKPRCTLQVHPSDAETLGLTTGEHATVTSAAAAVDAVVEVTDAVAPGTVSLPHGWGHDIDGVKMTVASAAGGTNSNALTSSEIDPVSGNAQLNAIPVTIAAATGQSGL